MSRLEKSGWLPPAKAGLQVPLPRSHFVLAREANQHRDKPLAPVEDHHALLVEACRNPYRLKGEAHAAA
jgi:hypothetical protein